MVYGRQFPTDCALDRMLELHRRKSAACTIAVFHREDVTASGIVDVDDNGRVSRFLEKPTPDQVFSHWVNAGVLAMDPRVLDFIPTERPSDFGRDILPALLAAGEAVYAYRMSTERLLWIDSPQDYSRAQHEMESLEQKGFR